MSAPTSIPALEMDADTNEQQGKWDQAEKDYRTILEQNPRYPGIHFRLARLLLSKPSPPPDFAEQAKTELQQELEIDPSNAGAEYVLGELARQVADYPSAIQHFSKATQLETNFADAYLGLGMSFLAEKKFTEAVAPLEKAVKFQPANPAGHYGLATAYAHTGRKEDADREFALQQQTADRAAGQGAQKPQ
jgi:Tfp pilus assembly protein PilF